LAARAAVQSLVNAEVKEAAREAVEDNSGLKTGVERRLARKEG
jgi:hypothetical protein